MTIDKAALLKHIKTKANHPKLLVYAVLMGLATAIERGDFDEEITSKYKERYKTDGTSVV